jgi:hypothetical protein
VLVRYTGNIYVDFMIRFYYLSFVIIFLVSCEKEYVRPIDIFAIEELTDTFMLGPGQNGDDMLMVNQDRIIETSTGYHVKGTIFAKSESGIIPVTSGDFKINTRIPASSLKSGFGGFDFKGYGTASLPSAGLFSASDIGQIPGSEVYYNTGKIFKSQTDINHLPLLDERYYFRHKVDNADDGREYRMKKIILKFREFYLDARDPAALFVGDVFSESAPGARKKIIEEMAVGISANELWEFNPYQYSDNLEKVSGGTGFESMNGGISLSGIIPVKKYPVKVFGQAVINTSFSSKGSSDFFERGFDEASFRIGVNGELFFTNSLVTFLTGTDTVKLGKATLQAEFSDENSAVRMAGEYSDNVLEQLLGKNMMKYIPVNSREGLMYMRFTDDPDDFVIYVEEKISMQVPGLGIIPLSNAIFKVTKNDVRLTGVINLPFGIGDVEVTGLLTRDGSFLLKGTADCIVNIGAGMNYNAGLDIEVSEKGVEFSGSMVFPFGIGRVEMEGGISTDELSCSGNVRSVIPFPVNAGVNSNLLMSVSTKKGVILEGGIDLPGGIGSVTVTGILNPDELLLGGKINSGVGINLGNVELKTNGSMDLVASSKAGVVFTGAVSLPFGFGNGSVTARLTSYGLSMEGSLGSAVKIASLPVFDASMTFSANSLTGLYLKGKMKFPGGFGWVSVSGFVSGNGFELKGDLPKFSIDFGVVSLSTGFDMTISQSGVRTTASGRGCIDLLVGELCETVGVDVQINYNNQSVRLCIDSVLGSACIGW